MGLFVSKPKTNKEFNKKCRKVSLNGKNKIKQTSKCKKYNKTNTNARKKNINVKPHLITF